MRFYVEVWLKYCNEAIKDSYKRINDLDVNKRMKRKYNNQLNTMSEKNSTLTLKRGILNTVNSDVELKQRHLYESSIKVQEVIVTIEENNEKLYRQYRALM